MTSRQDGAPEAARELNACEVEIGVDPAMPGTDCTAISLARGLRSFQSVVHEYDPSQVTLRIGDVTLGDELAGAVARAMGVVVPPVQFVTCRVRFVPTMRGHRWGRRRLRRARRRRIASNRARRAERHMASVRARLFRSAGMHARVLIEATSVARARLVQLLEAWP